MKRALLSVSDKTGLVDFAKILVASGYEILSTGGTLKELHKSKIQAVSVEEVTGFPECFGGRVKTMHPMIMGGILFNREIPEHVEQAKELKIFPIDLVAVNLYPFEETAADQSKTDAEIIDGAVRGIGRLTIATALSLRGVQNGFVRSYAAFILIGALAMIVAIWVVVQ